MNNTTYPFNKEEKALKNKVELISLGFYALGLILVAVTKMPAFIAITALSIPVCKKIFKTNNDN